MKDVLLIVLGSVLALGTSVVLEFVRGGVQQRRARRLLSALIKDEIPAINSIIDALIDDTSKLGYIPAYRLTEITAARQGYDRNRDWVILYKDESLRRGLFNYYSELLITCGTAHALETLAATPAQSERPGFTLHYKTKRDEILAKFGRLASKGMDLVNQMR